MGAPVVEVIYEAVIVPFAVINDILAAKYYKKIY